MSNTTALIRQTIEVQSKTASKIESRLKSMPEGCLYRSVKSNNSYYYHCISRNGVKTRRYIGTAKGKNAQLIADLKRKRFLLYCKKVLEENVVALSACLLKYEEFDPSEISNRMAASYENITDGQVSSRVEQDDCTNGRPEAKEATQKQQSLEWRFAPYPKAEMHPEGLKHEAIGGIMMRSKSEALIAFVLDMAEVSFHYEELLQLGDKKTAPDFTILHPRSGEKMYWEHFGMMDDPAYATETYRKLVLYGQNHIVPGKNLIFTMETNEEPLSISEVQRLVSYHFTSTLR